MTPLADVRGLRLDCRIDEHAGAAAFDEARLVGIVAALLVDAVIRCRGDAIIIAGRALADGGIEVVVDRSASTGGAEKDDASRSPLSEQLLNFIAEQSAETGGWVQIDKAGDDVFRTKFTSGGTRAEAGSSIAYRAS